MQQSLSVERGFMGARFTAGRRFERNAPERNHILLSFLVGVAFVLAFFAGHWYGFGRTHDMNTLLTTRSCQGCDLCGANLAGLNLAGVNLRHARLKAADLSHADLRYANLSGASLYRANLAGADLRRVNLVGTHLLFADLSGAIWVDGIRLKALPRK